MTTQSAKPPRVMGVAEIAEFCDIPKPNVRKMLARYNVKPIATLAVGPVYSRSSIERMQAKRFENLAGRAADEKRRVTARRKLAERT